MAQVKNGNGKTHKATEPGRLRIGKELVVGWELDEDALSILLQQAPKRVKDELAQDGKQKLFCCRECAAHVPSILLGEPASDIPNNCEVCGAPVALKMVG